jgi:hypothetical protein
MTFCWDSISLAVMVAQASLIFKQQHLVLIGEDIQSPTLIVGNPT